MTASRNNFDFFRLLAAFLVIIGHAYPILQQPNLPNFLNSSISSYAVKIFFALSGYLIVASWIRDPNAQRFLVKRALRIFPALILVVVLSACFLGPLITALPLKEYFSSHLFWSYFLNIRLYITYSLPGVFEQNIYPNAVNGSLWSLPAEFFMYLLVLGLGILARILNYVPFALLWGVLTICCMALNISEIYFQTNAFAGTVIYATSVRSVIEMAPYFMIGGCIQLARHWLPLSPRAALLAMGFAMVVTEAGYSAEPLLILISSYSVIALGATSTLVLRDFGRFGDLSYGVYLYGFPVAQTLSWGFGASLSFATHVFLALLVSVLCAFVSWHSVEKRALQIKPTMRRVVSPGTVLAPQTTSENATKQAAAYRPDGTH